MNPKRPHPVSPTPADLRAMFGANLRLLCANAPSIAGLCRELGINRTQFNRYLSGESFPRPDVLHRICSFFDVDARILLEPVEKLTAAQADLLNHPVISEFVGEGAAGTAEEMFPTGIYSFSRHSFMDEAMFVRGLVRVYREDNYTFIRGLEPKAAMRQQGLPTDIIAREFRGFVLPQEGGIAALISRRRSMTCSFNFLSRVPSYENNYWSGYATRTVPESISGRRAARMVYEYLGNKTSQVLEAARLAGFCRLDDLQPYHRTLLRPEEPFQ